MSEFKPIHGLCTKLCKSITNSQGSILEALDAGAKAYIAAELSPDGYTYLILQSSYDREVIRISADGGVLRGQEGTSQRPWPAGTRLYFDWTRESMKAFMACINAEEAGDVAPIKVEGYTSTFDATTGQWCLESNTTADTSNPVEWYNCGVRFWWDGSQVQREAELNPQQDGVYKNATVTVVKGKPRFTEGCPLIYDSSCAECDCD